jgi:type VI protein secretion system component VasF
MTELAVGRRRLGRRIIVWVLIALAAVAGWCAAGWFDHH